MDEQIERVARAIKDSIVKFKSSEEVAKAAIAAAQEWQPIDRAFKCYMEDFYAIKWTGDNLKEVIEVTGRHPSIHDWPWEKYENLVREKGFKLFTDAYESEIVNPGSIIVKENDCDVFTVYTEPEFKTEFQILPAPPAKEDANG